MDFFTQIAEGNPSQSHWELNELIKRVLEINPQNILELGIHRAGSVRVWQKVFNPYLMIGVNNTNEVEGEIDFTFIQGNTHSPEVYDQVVDKLRGGFFDFIFIDAGHLYPEVKEDFEIWSPLVRPGGIIGFHDVVIRDNETCEVYQFWEEVRKNHKSITIWDGTPAGTGEGILWI